MSVFHENMLIGSSGQGGAAAAYQIERSLRFNSADSAYLSRTPASAGNRKTWTWAGWVKRSAFGAVSAMFGTPSGSIEAFDFNGSDSLRFYTGGGGTSNLSTTAVFRDPSAWYHIVLAVDTTQSTAANRARIYVNGDEITSFSGTYPTQNYDCFLNAANALYIGDRGAGSQAFNGYLADVHFIDGQQLTPSSFTEVSATTGQLIPKAYTGSFGTNGFWLKLSDNSGATATTLGKDYSGNSNNWTPNNLSVTAGAGNDSLVDTPTSYGTDTGAGSEVRGNYCTWNPLCVTTNNTLSNGNLEAAHTAGTGWTGNSLGSTYAMFVATMGVTSGKWYWEGTFTSATTGSVGIVNSGAGLQYYVGYGAKSVGYTDTYVYNNGFGSAVGSMPSYAQNDIIGVAIDMDNGKLYFSKNGTFINSGNPAAGTGNVASGLTGETVFPAVSQLGSSDGISFTANFGQRPFAYTAPSGFKALCTTNLPAPVVAKPSEAMDVALYTGNNSARSITGLGFSPDFVWIKGRSGATDHALYDAVRGVQKDLVSNSTAAETTQTQGLTAFNSDGFSLGTLAKLNTNAATYAGWCWDAGSSTVTNTQGSITSQVRANASAGFSIVTYTGTGANATVGHGLGVAPSLVIVKNRETATNWPVWHSSIPATNYLELNTTLASTAASSLWNNTAPTSSVISVGTDTLVNQSTKNMLAYCFAPVAGYSNGFSYTGNGSTDGSFVYLGFRPRLILLKCSSTTGNWTLLDTAREGYNVDNDPLYPNLSNAEGTTDLLDITSNGFKLRTTDASVNSSGATYVGYAWAEAPFAYSRAR